MRAKDVLDAETKTAQRTVDRQNKLLEKAQETEKSLQGQIVAQEQAITKLKTALAELQKQGIVWSSEKTTLELQLQHVQKHLAEVRLAFADQSGCVYCADCLLGTADNAYPRGRFIFRQERQAEIGGRGGSVRKDYQEAQGETRGTRCGS